MDPLKYPEGELGSESFLSDLKEQLKRRIRRDARQRFEDEAKALCKRFATRGDETTALVAEILFLRAQLADVELRLRTIEERTMDS